MFILQKICLINNFASKNPTKKKKRIAIEKDTLFIYIVRKYKLLH